MSFHRRCVPFLTFLGIIQSLFCGVFYLAPGRRSLAPFLGAVPGRRSWAPFLGAVPGRRSWAPFLGAVLRHGFWALFLSVVPRWSIYCNRQILHCSGIRRRPCLESTLSLIKSKHK